MMMIGGWRTRSVFERYAIVNRSDMNDANLKLQESEKRARAGSSRARPRPCARSASRMTRWRRSRASRTSK